MCPRLSAGKYGLLYHGSVLTQTCSFIESFISLSADKQFVFSFCSGADLYLAKVSQAQQL